MEGVKITTVNANDSNGRAEVYRGSDKNFIKYFDAQGNLFFTEEVEGNITKAESKAEDWALGYNVIYG